MGTNQQKAFQMIEISCQLKENILRPFSQEDQDGLKEYKENQVVRVKIQGAKKPRSLQQLRLFWVCCRMVAENTENPHWNTKDKVAFQIKIALQLVDMDKTIVDARGNIHLHYRSIAFRNLAHMEACNFFDRAFDIMAKTLGMDRDTLLKVGEKNNVY